MNETRSHGRFIVLEGGDGAGKSAVQAALVDHLRGHLRATSRDVIATREPGGTELGERIRDLVLSSSSVGDPLSELLLFEAARAHLVATVIRPALDAGAIVICDRFAASSTAYQGYGRNLGRKLVEQANSIATSCLTPDLTLLLDVPVEVGLRRRANDGAENHFDNETLDFHNRVRNGFLELARENPSTWTVIDASQPLAAVIDDARSAVTPIL